MQRPSVYERYKEEISMIRLTDITEENWLEVASLSVREDQERFLAPAAGIIARGYVYRDCNARVIVIENDDTIVGVALVREFTDEPLGYDLQQFMIDRRYQGRGYGSEALRLILDELRAEGHFDHVEVCVKKDDAKAIRLYEKHGFTDSGYIDEDAPDSLNMICWLKGDVPEMKTIEELLGRPYWIIDILPKQVPEGSPGKYFTVEDYLLREHLKEIKNKHISLILKLNCYMDITIDGEKDPSPEKIRDIMSEQYVYIMVGDSMILSEPDDTHMTLFDPTEDLLSLVRQLSAAEGLFVWKPEDQGEK